MRQHISKVGHGAQMRPNVEELASYENSYADVLEEEFGL